MINNCFNVYEWVEVVERSIDGSLPWQSGESLVSSKENPDREKKLVQVVFLELLVFYYYLIVRVIVFFKKGKFVIKTNLNSCNSFSAVSVAVFNSYFEINIIKI